MTEIFFQNGTVERADRRDVERRRLFQKRLNLRAVLADYSDIIPSRLVVPRLVSVKRAGLAEAVGGKQNAVTGVVSHHDLGPMHHRSGNEGQRMSAERKRITFPDNDSVVAKIRAEKVLHHHKRLRA